MIRALTITTAALAATAAAAVSVVWLVLGWINEMEDQ